MEREMRNANDERAATVGQDVAGQVLSAWDFCGALEREACIEGELLAIKHYVTKNNLPPWFLRVALHAGLSAYLALRSELPTVLPMPFRNADGSPNDRDISAGLHSDEP
jgi:hypothetical protein